VRFPGGRIPWNDSFAPACPTLSFTRSPPNSKTMSDSNLNIFIVGPVGAGKTVFACMLNAHVMAHPEAGVNFKAGDWNTKKHLADIHDVLAKQEWPLGTLPLKAGEKFTELRWEWEFGRRRAFFNLVDPAGEDIERAMRGEGDKLPILDSIRAADVLFVLVDLHGHQGDTAKKRAQNGWIIENVLREAAKVRRLVIGISKGDLEHRLPVEAWTDKEKLMVLISESMPEFNLNAYRSQLQSTKVQMVMFSAVATESYLDDKEVLRQRPKKSLASQGLEIFVKSITEAHDHKKKEEIVRKVTSTSIKTISSRWFWKMLGVLFILYLLYWFVRSAL
jgi:hypothetical protein